MNKNKRERDTMTNDFLMLMQIENFLLKEENCH